MFDGYGVIILSLLNFSFYIYILYLYILKAI